MKGTENFKKTISTYLNMLASKNELFAKTMKKPEKNIDDCITYILNTVQKSGCNGFDDNEIYQIAVHYYDEDDINVGNPSTASVVVNHVVELTEEEKENARQEAKDKLVHEQLEANRKEANKGKKKTQSTESQQTLF